MVQDVQFYPLTGSAVHRLVGLFHTRTDRLPGASVGVGTGVGNGAGGHVCADDALKTVNATQTCIPKRRLAAVVGHADLLTLRTIIIALPP